MLTRPGSIRTTRPLNIAAMVLVAAVAIATTALPLSVAAIAVGGAAAVGLIATESRLEGASEVVAFGVVLELLLHGPANASPELKIATVGAILAYLLPFAIWRLRDTTTLPLAHLYGVLASAYLLVGLAFSRSSDTDVHFVTTGERFHAMVLTGAFALCLSVGVACVVRRDRLDTPSADEPILHRCVIILIAGFVLSSGITILHLRTSLGAIPATVDTLRLVGVLGIFAACLSGKASQRWMIFAVGVLVLGGLSGLGTSALYNAARGPLAALVLYVSSRRRVPWLSILFVALLILFLNVGKTEFRRTTAATRGNQNQVGLNYLRSSVSHLPDATARSISLSAARFSYSASDALGLIAAKVPKDKSFWGATTYRNLPFVLIPRALVPSKAKFGFGNEFGRRYGILGPTDVSTAANVPLPVEAYVSYGLIGLVTAGLIIGLVFGWLTRRFSGSSVETIIVGSILTVAVLGGVESDSLLTFGTVPVILLTVVPLVKWMVRRRPVT